MDEGKESLRNMTVGDLRIVARRVGVKGAMNRRKYHGKNRGTLIDDIIAHQQKDGIGAPPPSLEEEEEDGTPHIVSRVEEEEEAPPQKTEEDDNLGLASILASVMGVGICMLWMTLSRPGNSER